MSARNVELARRGYEAVSRGDLASLFDSLDPEVEWRAAQDPETYRGPEGVARSIAEWFEVFDDARLKAEEFIDAGDQVVVAVRHLGRGKESGIEMETVFYHVITIRDDRLVKLEEYTDRAAALEAAAAPEASPETRAEGAE
jgi:ketosteroid isomerase-like protein